MKLAAKQPWLSPDQVPHHHRAYFLWKLLPHYIDINSGATKESHCFEKCSKVVTVLPDETSDRFLPPPGHQSPIMQPQHFIMSDGAQENII